VGYDKNLLCLNTCANSKVTNGHFSFILDDVDDLISFKDAVSVAENAPKDLHSPKGTNAPCERLHTHRDHGEE